ncbi:hypothetical protein QBC37DRAFT_453435 [Rhypophila decipiens]|uniref:Uncharacterized protein n=1 Tax=Rhypophila decipiens TaxID=261697 RepID=A0AAN6XWZ3_9PEZI|nr:hypothetical protein QBC37DRAFT_453435 [Rhypophila decipiens]
MDPLSAIASVLAITEAFGVGVKTLKGLADTSSEFSDMLAELSSLQAWLDQLRLTIDNMTVAQVQVPLDVLRRLELARVELSQVVNAMGDIRVKLMGDEKEKKLSKKGVPKVSVITWQRMRGRIQKLKDRAKRCREELSACLDLVGLSQHLQQHQTSRDILTISHTQYSLMQTTLVKFEPRFNDLESMLLRNMPTPEPPVMEPLPEEHCAEPDSTDKSRNMVSSENGMTRMDREFSTTRIQVPVRQLKCSRYCKCQCHRSSAIRTPSWSQALVGSIMLQYNGTVRLDSSPCDTPGCKSGKGRELRVAYAFPSWLTRRAVQLSAYWGSLTDMGASLHLRVPTVRRATYGMNSILYKEDMAGLREIIATRHLLPTDVSVHGRDFLLICLSRHCFQSASFLLDVGSPKQLARHLLLEDKLGLGIIRDKLGFQTCVKIAGDIEEQSEVSTLTRDAILGIGNVNLEDALALEGCRVNKPDDGGYSPLHWAVRLDKQEHVRQLVEYGADIELPNRYQHTTPLRLAVFGCHRQIVAFLLSKGASTAARDINGCGMLHGCTDSEVVRMLLEANADPNEAQCPGKRSPLHHLVEDYLTTARLLDKKRCDIALQLLRAGCDLEARSSVGSTALLTAVRSGHHEMTRFLHRRGARVDAIDNDSYNILHYTASTQDLSIIDCIRSLKIGGIDPDCENTFGETAVAHFKGRTRQLGIGDMRQTQRSVFSFYALISEIRCRNRELSMFLERKEQLERNGHVKNIRGWLGWQWQMMHDDPEFAYVCFNDYYDQYPEDFIYEELKADYNTDILFGRLDQVMDSPGMSQDGEEDYVEEFFDAME